MCHGMHIQVNAGLRRRSRVKGKSRFRSSGRTVIGLGVWPWAQKRALRRASAAFALTGNEVGFRSPGCTTW